jgi:MarR family transcriptional regulator, organic hydroperoxide resistance regulator
MSESEDSALMNKILNFSRVYNALFGEIFNKIDSENSRAGIKILFILKKKGPMPISHIAEKMAIARPNMTLIVDALTNKGLVERCSSDTDRRIINVALTGEGVRYLDKIVAKRDEILKESISILSETEKAEVTKALEVLIRASEKILNI